MAGDFFSMDHASKVANLVSNALGSKPSPPKHTEGTNNIFSGFLRLFGFENKQISAIAVNAIILIAQLIGTSLNPPSKIEPKQLKEDTPFDWMLNNSVIANLLSDTQDQKLPDKVIDYVTERSLDEETGCVQLLLCKMKPFIKEMQRALRERGKRKLKGYGILFEYFPSAEAIADNGDRCDEKYYYCTIPI
ncbi:uncharacterized protein [Diabrotica undecimpunctata]|uniref:uncharacterized protein n=1 Tax=Diabrotica undecimpunctata TaxID=50387 RepID=UPI003B63E22C